MEKKWAGIVSYWQSLTSRPIVIFGTGLLTCIIKPSQRNTTTLNVYIELCFKLISLSTCKKLSGIVRQRDLGHHHPPPLVPLKFQERPASYPRSKFSRLKLLWQVFKGLISGSQNLS